MTKIARHFVDSIEPDGNRRSIGFYRSDANFRSEMEVADRERQRFRQGKPLMFLEAWIGVLLQAIEQNQRFVQGQRADRVRQQKVHQFRIECAQVLADRRFGRLAAVRILTDEQRVVLDAVGFEQRPRPLSDIFGVLEQFIRIGRPVGFDLRREMGEGVGFDAHTGDAQFFALDDGCACTAERIKHAMPAAKLETLDILPHQVRREGKHKPVPVVRRTILIEQSVHLAIAQAMALYLRNDG